MSYKVNYILLAALILTASPVFASTAQEIQAAKAERAVAVLQEHDFEGLESAETRQMLYKALGPSLAGNETLQSKMSAYRDEDQDFISHLVPVTKPAAKPKKVAGKHARSKSVTTASAVHAQEASTETKAPVVADNMAGTSESEPLSYTVNGKGYEQEDGKLNAYDGLDFSKGHGMLYVGMEVKPKFTLDAPHLHSSATIDTKFNGRVIAGLDGKSAIGYSYHKHGYSNSYFNNVEDFYSEDESVASHGFDYFYKVAPGLALTAGLHRDIVSMQIDLPFSKTHYLRLSSDDNRWSWTAGLLGRWQLTDWLTFNAVTGWGPNLVRYDVGLGFTVAPNAEIYLGYENYLYKNLTTRGDYSSAEYDVRFSGFNAGVNFKF